MDKLKKKSYELRLDIVNMLYKAKAGHIGGDMSVIDILTVLYYEVMNVSPKNWNDENRDRFLLSKGHCADALYVVLGDLGFFDKKEVLENFSSFGSKFIGHPSMDVKGVELNSGSLGHGLSLGVGMALAGKMNKKSYHTYVVLGDGEMAEGSNYEAMMAASHYKLDNLCATLDYNRLQISGSIQDVMQGGDIVEKFQAFGWHIIQVEDGNDCQQLKSAYQMAKKVNGKPVIIIANTVKGKGISFMENQPGWHHGVMKQEEYEKALKEIQEVIR